MTFEIRFKNWTIGKVKRILNLLTTNGYKEIHEYKNEDGDYVFKFKREEEEDE